jgi:gamma-glutamylcyclotransferase (GGCT)/AIG2-like uncharacterized protein YtfP
MQKSREIYLFVYGTLMSNNRKGHTYLSDARFLGECTLKLKTLKRYSGYNFLGNILIRVN